MKRLQNNKFGMIWAILPRHIRPQSFVVLLLTILGAGLEMLGLGMVLPALSILLDPGSIQDIGLPSALGETMSGLSNDHLVITSMLFLLGIYVVKGGYLGMLTWIQASFAYKIKATLSDDLLSTYMNASHEFHLSENSARLIRNITMEVEQFISHVLVPTIKLISELFIVAAVLGLLIYVNPMGSVCLLVVVGISMLAFQKLTQGLLLDWGRRRQDAEALRIQRAQESLGSIKETRLLNRESFFLAEYSTWNWLSSNMARNQLALSQLPYIWLEIVAIGALSLMVFLAIQSDAQSSQIIPMVGLFAAAAFRIIPSANRILMALQALKYASAVIELMDREISHPQGASSVGSGSLEFQKQIVLQNLTYQYPSSDITVITDVSISVHKGEKVGIIGTSGAGKSTLVSLFLGLIVPSSGTIKVDGTDVFKDIRSWQKHIGYVPQQIFLTDNTLRRNIAFGLPDKDIDEEMVFNALDRAQLIDFVKSLPDGLDTLVGERGVRLSGGQLQRIGIARALYNKPSILVLDEASSALDVRTEASLMDSIESLGDSLTLIIVTHRLSTLKNCDRIYRIEKGIVAEELDQKQ